ILSEDLKSIVRRSVELSMIKIDEREFEEFVEEVSKLMNLVKKLDEIDLGEIEPLFYVWERGDILREDEPKDHGDEMIKWLEKNSRVENRYVKAPRTVEER
ncbi:MAG: Asp-tRNA(Asn)/Glu-tRNA(Gln) amidotransferase subunit GatC, partial [Desulfurococcales archaeon]|nr:Asp-tRNA(Asn)/Glu-tRNA(Gln) amidotransferase subunit GatC [Desulfurococcales archaeon]